MAQVVSPYQPHVELEPTAWDPPAEVKEHSRQPISSDADFFAPPPPEIGPVITAFTSLKRGKHPMNLGLRAGLSLGAFLVIFVTFALMGIFGDADTLMLFMGIGLMLGAAAAVVMFVLWRFRHTCSYVGQLGVARFTAQGSRERIKPELFLFSEASDLTTGQTRQYVNGAYTGTDYTFNWLAPDGRSRFKLSGRYYSAKGNPKRSSPFWLALSAESAWNDLLVEVMNQELQQHGAIRFMIDKKQWVRVGRGFFEFGAGDTLTDRIESAQIKKFQVAAGHITIHSHDAKLFRSRGKHGFSYGQMRNARLFMMACEQLVGMRFG